MINSAEEFVRLSSSDNPEEYNRAAHDEAGLSIWYDVINTYPDYKTWVIHNKTIPVEILELLAKDNNPEIRSEVARKRKINDVIFNLLANDIDVNVRHALICNTKLSKNKLSRIKVSDSEWLQKQLEEKLEL